MSAHHDEQQELENAKYLWNNGGKWLVVALVSIALIYWGKGIYRNYQLDKYAQAAAMATQVKGDVNKLAQLQKDFSGSAAAAQASLETAALLFEQGKTDQAIAAYQWVLNNNKTPVFQAAAVQNLANVYLQQKQYDNALKILATPIEASFQSVIEETKGDVFAAQGKTTEAKQIYQAILDKLPEQSPARELIQLKISQL
ncbi:MAG: tetratricopeptide repeat protein [Neisseriaceae bacterium]|nr:tetratricopeptide repeat protein [Neisseriaceae bacterium]